MSSKPQSVLMTDGSPIKRIVTFAAPIFLGNLFQQLYNTVDSLVVGNFLGKSALAAVSSSGSLIFLMVGFFTGISVGAGVVISRFFGARDIENVHKAVHTTVAFGLVAGILLTAIGVPLTPYILRWMDTPENVMVNSVKYFQIYFAGVTAIVLYNIAVGILQAVGDSRHPLQYLMISSTVNVVLDLLFVGVFHFGVGAAALATTISQALSAFLAFWRLTHVTGEFRVELKKIRFHKDTLKMVLSTGLPTGVQNSIIAFANVIVQSSINVFQDAAVAGCGSYAKVEGYAFLPITSFSMAITTFISQNLGAKKYDRAKKGATLGCICSVTLAELIGVAIYIGAPYLIAAFNRDPEVVAFGTRQARTASLFYCLLAFSHCIAGTMRGAGKAKVPMFVMLICWCVIRVTYIKLVTFYTNDIVYIFWAYPITWFLSSVTFLIYFLKSDWIHGFEQTPLASASHHHHHK